MKKLLFLLSLAFLFSCSQDEASTTEEAVNLTVNHFKVPAEFVLANDFLVQEEGDNFFRGVEGIQNFNPQPGIVYQLQATKITTQNKGSDISVVSYRMEAVISETAVGPNDSFTVQLTRNNTRTGRVDSWVTGNDEVGYFISAEIPIECQGPCDAFNAAHIYENEFSGTFKHGENGAYILLDIF